MWNAKNVKSEMWDENRKARPGYATFGRRVMGKDSLDNDAPESVLHGATTFSGTFCREAYAHCSISDVPVVPSTVAMVILVRSHRDTEYSESRSDFHCGGAKGENSDLVRGQCFELYMKQNNKHGLPVYGFVILNFFLIASVCVIYSLMVSSTVDRLSPSARHGDQRQSRDGENALSSGKKLFFAYCCQIFARIVFGVLLIVLQTQIFYPTDFPSRFRCDPNSGGDQPRNSTGVIQNSTSILHDCHNQRATKKNSWMYVLLVVNGFFVFVVLMEAVYILLQAWKKDGFVKNSQFLIAHLNPSYGRSLNAVNPTGPTQELHEVEERTDHEMNIPHMPCESEQLRTTPLQVFIEKTKKIVKKNTCRPPQLRSPFSSTPGEGHPAKHLSLDQIYTKLVVVEDIASYNFTGDRRDKLEVYVRSEIEYGESSSEFHCNGERSESSDLVHGQCFELYQKQNNKHGLLIYGFVILNFFLIASVCAIYSLKVNSTIDQTVSKCS
ncbi:hypothetical protein AWC38_SpisGene21581 [Stylophora pistillata]|uniref:Uncharacterized protein n=1 Tax=Stylophora pistillata TaxID=50429 RepID=A0A2B4RBW0_STYPI|nr:hypothetical protein AWC38_SpisGene21581 [Stylophora pistillata]